MTVDYEEFLAEVRRDGALPSEEDAVRAARAALQTLGERLSGGEARDLARYLPEPVRSWLHDGEQPEPFGVDEYLHRVARREGVAEPDAARHALAVFAALGRAADPDEIRDMGAELPKDFRTFLVAAEAAARAAEDREPVPAATFILRVVAHGGLDLDTAWRAADAVLDALGERISSGQVKDLAARLPEELADALRRGDARSKGEAKPLSLTEFVRRVADLEDVSPDEARRHARAVFLALRDVVGEKEFGDTVAQLPAEYGTVLDGDAPAADTRPTRARAAEPVDQPVPGALTGPEAVEVHAPKDLPREKVATARERLAELQRYTDRPMIDARLTLRYPDTRPARRRWIADASIVLDGRVLAAHATGPSALDATDAVVDRLRRRIRGVVGSEVALRNEPRVIAKALADLRLEPVHRPASDLMPTRPGERRLVHRTVASGEPASVAEAAADLVDHDHEFRLFRHDLSGEWLLVHRRDDDRIGVMHPPWMSLPDIAGDVFVVEPLPHSEPMTLDQAEAELDRSERRFLYFVDAADGRPKVLHLRHDGDYGLVEPAPDVP